MYFIGVCVINQQKVWKSGKNRLYYHRTVEYNEIVGAPVWLNLRRTFKNFGLSMYKADRDKQQKICSCNWRNTEGKFREKVRIPRRNISKYSLGIKKNVYERKILINGKDDEHSTYIQINSMCLHVCLLLVNIGKKWHLESGIETWKPGKWVHPFSNIIIFRNTTFKQEVSSSVTNVQRQIPQRSIALSRPCGV